MEGLFAVYAEDFTPDYNGVICAGDEYFNGHYWANAYYGMLCTWNVRVIYNFEESGNWVGPDWANPSTINDGPHTISQGAIFYWK